MPQSEEMDALWPCSFPLDARSVEPGDRRAAAARAALMQYARDISDDDPKESECIRHAVVREADREKMLVPIWIPMFPPVPLLVPGEAPPEMEEFYYRIEYRPEVSRVRLR